MTFTRKSIADYLDSYDDEITALQDSKRDTLNDYRQQLADKGFGKAAIKAEIDGLKVAMRRRRAIAKKGAEEIEQADAIADEIFLEITSVSRAPRATREIIEEFPPHDPETGELTDNQESDQPDAAVSPRAAAVASDETAAQDDVGATASSTNTNSSDPLRSDKAETLPSSPEVSAANSDLRPRSQAAASPASDAAPSEAGATMAAASRSSSMTAREIDATIPAFLRRTEGGYPKREVEGV